MRFWHLSSDLCRAALWQAWIAMNARIFSTEDWPGKVLQQALWNALLSAGRVAWLKLLRDSHRRLWDLARLLCRFDAMWMFSESLGSRNGLSVTWVSARPREVLLI
ncbi:hypothetical protein M758_UG225600 [Ceratodon purpureus]|nr:hypothetical protein M758_UG225600 [Ceratodon purpureus]